MLSPKAIFRRFLQHHKRQTHPQIRHIHQMSNVYTRVTGPSGTLCISSEHICSHRRPQSGEAESEGNFPTFSSTSQAANSSTDETHSPDVERVYESDWPGRVPYTLPLKTDAIIAVRGAERLSPKAIFLRFLQHRKWQTHPQTRHIHQMSNGYTRVTGPVGYPIH